MVSIAYDSAERVGTITRPDASTEEFSPYQEQGWTNSGTSGSPAPATLLAAGGRDLHRPQRQPDGAAARLVRAGDDRASRSTPWATSSTYDLNSNGLPTVAIDPLNRITRSPTMVQGNVTEHDLSRWNNGRCTYNSYSEPLTPPTKTTGSRPTRMTATATTRSSRTRLIP